MPPKAKPGDPTPGKTEAPAPEKTDTSAATAAQGLASKIADKAGEGLSSSSAPPMQPSI